MAAATPLEAARISCLMNAYYHESREAFLDSVHRWFMFAVIALGAAAVVNVLPAELRGFFAAGTALLAALDLTFDLSNRARLHSMMKRRYFELLADVGEGRKTFDELRVCLDRFSADEPPSYRVLLLSCWNSAQKTVYGPKAMAFEISKPALLFKNFFRRPSASFPVKKISSAASV